MAKNYQPELRLPVSSPCCQDYYYTSKEVAYWIHCKRCNSRVILDWGMYIDALQDDSMRQMMNAKDPKVQQKLQLLNIFTWKEWSDFVEKSIMWTKRLAIFQHKDPWTLEWATNREVYYETHYVEVNNLITLKLPCY